MAPRLGLVVDADVISFLFKKDPVRAPRYERHTNGRTLYLPFAARAELLYGAEVRRWGFARRTELVDFLHDYTTVESDPELAENWVEIRTYSRWMGRRMEAQDAWVAAVAVSLDLPLLTHNSAHFKHLPGLQVITEPDT